MTLRAVGFGRGFPRIWLLPIGSLTVLLGVAASGRLSRALVADLIAWWPAWVGLGLTAYLMRERKFGEVRAAGLVPLGALVIVALFAWGHLAGWSLMPSAAHRLVGPEIGAFVDASLTAEVDGGIVVTGGSPFLYQVEPIRRGGRIGIPGADEQVVDSSISVVLDPPTDPGLYSYAGWDLRLSSTPSWDLNLDGAIDADLTAVSVDELRLAGSGLVMLGETDGTTEVTVRGSFRIILASETPARVVGVASVPASWTLTGAGAMSPAEGDGWVIRVASGATLTVMER